MSSESTIYVQLVGEGTLVWRAVSAERRADGTWVILGSVPEYEEWEFVPGTAVRCEEKLLSGDELGLVAIEAVQA